MAVAAARRLCVRKFLTDAVVWCLANLQRMRLILILWMFKIKLNPFLCANSAGHLMDFVVARVTSFRFFHRVSIRANNGVLDFFIIEKEGFE